MLAMRSTGVPASSSTFRNCGIKRNRQTLGQIAHQILDSTKQTRKLQSATQAPSAEGAHRILIAFALALQGAWGTLRADAHRKLAGAQCVQRHAGAPHVDGGAVVRRAAHQHLRSNSIDS